MKIKKGFILRKVAGKYVVVAIGSASRSLNGIIKLNDTGAFCWDYLLQGIPEKDLVNKLVSEYDVTMEQAEQDVKAFLDTLREAGCLDEE